MFELSLSTSDLDGCFVIVHAISSLKKVLPSPGFIFLHTFNRMLQGN